MRFTKLTQQDIDGCLTHVIVNIKNFSDFLLKAFHNVQAVAIECWDEWFQNVLMESWCDQFSVWTPMFAAADEQAIAQPKTKWELV